MMKMRFFVVALLALIVVGIAGTTDKPVSRELSELEFVRVIGVDRTGENLLRLTTSVSAATQGEAQGAMMLTGEAATLNSAAEKVQSYTDKYVFFGYVAQYLMGEETAREDMRPYLDYMERDLYTRLDTNFYVVRGAKAYDVVSSVSGDGDSLSERLTSLEKDAGMLLVPFSVTLRELITQFSRDSCAVVPSLELVKREQGDESTSSVSPDSDGDSGRTMVSRGYAVFGDYALRGYIDEKDLLGASMLLHRSTIAALDIEGENEKPVSLTVVSDMTSFEPVFRDGKLERVQVKSEVSANISEVQGGELRGALELLSDRAEDALRAQMESVLELSQTLGADFLGMGRQLEIAQPLKWRSAVGDGWRELLKTVDIDVAVTVNLSRTYEISEAM